MAKTKKTTTEKPEKKFSQINIIKCETDSDIKKYLLRLQENISLIDDEEKIKDIKAGVEVHLGVIENNKNHFIARRTSLYKAIGFYNYNL